MEHSPATVVGCRRRSGCTSTSGASSTWLPKRAEPTTGCYGAPVNWFFFGGLGGAIVLLVGRSLFRRKAQEQAADASGLATVHDLTHLPSVLQKTALWALAEGGFEGRI